jgi:UDP-hydrolysing UDP-N-acetyl-D-glucosamine 2-epimerase
MSQPRTICVVLVDRANYGRLWPVMRAIREHPDLRLQTICAGTMLLERFGRAEKVVQADGFEVSGRVYMELEGSVPVTMAKSVGLGILEFTNEFQRLAPDMVLVIGDRYEALAAAIAAGYMNLPLIHVQGGEVSGSIDECARHAITKFAHLHFPNTRRSADYIVRMGEDPAHVHNFGCPVGDYIRGLDTELPADLLRKIGVGPVFRLEDGFLLVIYHPVTTGFGTERAKVEQLLAALDEIRRPTLWIWPNIDAGSDDISKVLRVYRESGRGNWLHLVKNLDPVTFQKCLKRTDCAIGNSSSFIRDSSFSGTPVVLVGDRQVGREHADNLLACPAEKEAVKTTIQRQLRHGRYAPSDLYGTGGAAKRIAETIAAFRPYAQKRLHFIHEA